LQILASIPAIRGIKDYFNDATGAQVKEGHTISERFSDQVWSTISLH
jgi:hypothetical protein